MMLTQAAKAFNAQKNCFFLASRPPIRHYRARKRIPSEIVGIAAH
jgi:hypothetical protein